MMRKMGDPNGKTTNPLNTLFRQCLDTILEWCKENSEPPLGNDSETIKSASGVIREIVHYMDKDLEVADVFKDNIVRFYLQFITFLNTYFESLSN